MTKNDNIVRFKAYSDKIVMKNKEVFNEKNTTTKQTMLLKENMASQKEEYDMTDYITRKEFEQFEKRIEGNFAELNNKIENLPERLADKLKISNMELKQELQKERKEDKKSIITWSLTGTGIMLTAFGLIAKLLGLY